MRTSPRAALILLCLAACTAEGGAGEPGGDGGIEGEGQDDASVVPDGPPVALPAGSRVVDEVLNLVDAEATAQLETFLSEGGQPTHVVLRRGLTEPVNRFLALYREEYDFLYFVLDHELPGSGIQGAFEAINRPAEPGGVSAIEQRGAGYRTGGRLKGVAGFQYHPRWFGPLGHETLHYWANDLDPAFGFGASAEGHYGPHWGYSSVHGQLGGFDEATLRCVEPAGGLPFECVAGPDGKTRYVVDIFGPNVNSGNPYAPLELYLMGLLPGEEVPEPLLLLREARMLTDTYDQNAGTVQVEASDLTELSVDDIVARHGIKPPMPEAERAMRAAFVVVSSAPASDEVMADIARWSAVFGAREEVEGVPSFAMLTGGRATMDTRLGAPRSQGESIPEAREYEPCDVLEQTCDDGQACVLSGPGVCVVTRNVPEDGACTSQFDCEPGFDCVSGPSAPDSYVCRPYCDQHDLAAPDGCGTLCGDASYLRITRNGEPLGAICLPR